MKVCIVTSAHPTDDVRVYQKLVRSFLSQGWDVVWVGPRRTYFDQPFDSKVDYRFIDDYSGKFRRLAAVRQIMHTALAVPDPVDWWYSPDPDSIFISLAVARRRGGRVLFDVHEAYHEALLDRYFGRAAPAPARALVRRVIARAWSRADLGVAVSESVRNHYAPSARPGMVVANLAPQSFAAPVARVSSGSQPMRIMHGKVLENNGTPVVLSALEEWNRSNTPGSLSVHMFRFPGDAALVDRAAAAGLVDDAALELLEAVPNPEMPVQLNRCDVGMIAYGRRLGVDSLPNRFFEYMASGLALLVPTYSPEMAKLVEGHGLGLAVDLEKPSEIISAWEHFLRHPDERVAMGARARTLFSNSFSWEAKFSHLASAMTSAGGRSGREIW